ncbi:uncharacterized protein LY89DRAFT_782295 [Mollisia scopiformis]|uniref:2EXR domain-containing protein n=1 Tax=Mollisia scopiformis TaxID=149040 RepID=A0A194XA95_MOLSC|nr:uncharacterized protein LY89DRAFT_782295 [Mollisia scopiformis]KUJ17093.1 hypothetical protein LY89DRAFT_782295 [Mollisia scopiformis]
MISPWNDPRNRLLELCCIEERLRAAYDCLCWIMWASDDEIDVSIALNELAGKRKREDDASNTDNESLPPAKISKASRESSPLQCPETPRLTPRETKFPESRQQLTRESLQIVRDRLSSLTRKNNEIKDSIQSLRTAVIDDLFSHMKIRQIAIGQLGRDDLDDDMRQLCTGALESRRDEIHTKQRELTTIEELLGGHKAVLEFADSAYEELEQNIQVLDRALSLENSATVLSLFDFPHLSALAKLTGGTTPFWSPPPEPAKARRRTHSFPQFAKLPPEIRLQIWQSALPNPRIITHNPRHNRNLALLAVNRESRAAILTKLTRLLSPTFETSKTDTKVIYVDLKNDTIIRDLANPEGEDAFDLEPTDFNLVCYRLFIGLAKVKHLALAFDILHSNGGQLFAPLQSCCPELENLILFPSSMVEGGPLKLPKQSSHHRLKFIDIDSNVIDYVFQRREQLSDRNLKRKALRGIAILITLYDHAQQYRAVFPEYIEQYGRSWTPSIRVCLVVKWNEKYRAWQTRYLEGDKYSKGYRGKDGKLYRGFVESDMMCGEDGEVLSRYDGIAEMFGRLEI